MSSHIELDEATSKRARDLKDCVRKLTDNMAKLDDIFDALAQMKTGDGSSASHFDLVATFFGVQAEGATAANAKAKTLHDELNSAKGNSAALRQLLTLLN